MNSMEHAYVHLDLDEYSIYIYIALKFSFSHFTQHHFIKRCSTFYLHFINEFGDLAVTGKKSAIARSGLPNYIFFFGNRIFRSRI